MTEEDVKHRFITPAIEKAGWPIASISMEYPISIGKIILRGDKPFRAHKRFADYVLSYKKNVPLAVIEAKDDSHEFGDGLTQAQEYAKKLDVRFVFTSNGDGFLYYDMKTATKKRLSLDEFPSPDELFNSKYGEDIKTNSDFSKIINTSYCFNEGAHEPRYYQIVAINRTVEAITKGKNRVLLVTATGTGKTYIASQIIWRLKQSGLKKKILYLADRNILVDQTMIGDFKPLKKCMTKIRRKNMDSAYEVYLSLYQQLSENESIDSLAMLRENFKPNFFDLIIVDECHRGSARDDSNWHKILEYFSSATQIGMTATPKETNETSNIEYFGEPIYTYSLNDGIEDGFLAPYRVIRYAIDVDVLGYRPEKNKTDVNGELVEDKEYGVKDYDKILVIDERTRLVAKRITEYLKATNRFDKTIVFCVDIEHAERMRQALVDENRDLCAKDFRYVMRITGDNDEGKKQLDNFVDNDSKYPTIVTTSKLMTTGVNCETCKNIVLDNDFGRNGMTEFKQIIGRGTRVNEAYHKMFFTILDFRNASERFADPKFNGPEVQSIDYDSNKTPEENLEGNAMNDDNRVENGYGNINNLINNDFESGFSKGKNKKVYINNVEVEVISKRIQYYDKSGKLVTESLKDFTKKNILQEFISLDTFLTEWSDEDKRVAIIKELEQYDVVLNELRKFYSNNVDDFDLICDIAYGVKPLTKCERIKKSKVDKVLEKYSDECKHVLEKLLEKYSDSNISGEKLADARILTLPEFEMEFDSPMNVIKLFGDMNGYIAAVKQIQAALYA